MSRIYEVLTDYVIRNGMVDEEDRQMYEYAFEVTAEVGLFIFVSLITVAYLHMYVEGILFFIIFMPLRSYAGGLHLEKFGSCFLFSCLTFSVILLAVKYIYVPAWISFTVFVMLEMAVSMLYPVENINRIVDLKENLYFKTKLKKYLIFDFIIGIICFFINDSYIFLIMVTFLMVVVTMVAGKYKNVKIDKRA